MFFENKMNYTQTTLGELLSSDNPAIKRNATGILRQLQKQKPKEPTETDIMNVMFGLKPDKLPKIED